MVSGPFSTSKREKKPGTFWSCLLLFFICSFPLLALEIPKRAEGYVSDYAGMLSPAARERLEQTLRQFEADTSNQVVVVTFPSLEGEVLEDFAIRLAEQWKVGQKGKDNGIILLIFKNDRQVRIEAGYGLEGVLPDATAKLIIENEIVPNFRQGKFDEGIQKAVESILDSIRGEYQPPASGQDSTDIIWAIFLLSFLLLISLPFIIYLLGGPIVLKGSRRYGDGGESDSWGSSGGSSDSGGFSGGGGGFGGGGASGRW